MEIHLCSDSDGETSRGKFLFVGYILVDAWTDSCSCKKKKIVFSFLFYVVHRNKGGIESLLSG